MLSASLRATFPWLASLKAAQLQRIARATGIQSSGTKAVLAERIGRVLRDTSQASAPSQRRDNPGSESSVDRTCRILSIDMGIRNLAFAHFRVSRSPTGSGFAVPELTAWRRLAVSDARELEIPAMPASSLDLGLTQRISPQGKETELEEQYGKEKEKGTFCPAIYAETAYTLITSLLSTHCPTHILIERQRFRSGGGSAVQEWTLRVGVLEGMLYAVLHALRQERGSETAQIHVEGVEPKRIVRYWMDAGSDSGIAVPDEGKISAREVKKAKIDLVGRWLDASIGGAQSSDAQKMNLSVSPDQRVQDLAGAYLRKWKSPNARKDAGVGKLDDLADCLLQGVTWLEWQAMREKMACEGEKALPCIP